METGDIVVDLYLGTVTGGQVPRHVTWFMYPKYAELGRALNQSVAEVA